MIEDRKETRNRIADYPERTAAMREQVSAFMDSCRDSHRGLDYSEPYQPVNEFQELRDWLPPGGPSIDTASPPGTLR